MNSPAVEELVTNLFDHGGLGAGDEIELCLSLTGDAIGVTITDRGRPFDPRSSPRPGQIPERGGGAGLALVRAWADGSDYEVSESGNRLSITLPLAERRIS